MKKYFLFIVWALFLFTKIALSQINSGGTPLSFTTVGLSDNLEVIHLSAPDISEFTLEDIENDENNFPQRIAANVPVNIDIQTAGSWEEIESGGKIWRIQLNCDGALALNVQFDAFYLPIGSNLFVYNEEKSQILGAYTSINNDEDGLFSTELIGGEAVIVEYYEPEFTNELVELSISDLAYAYRNVSYVLENSEDFGDSDWCQVNVNCSPEGDNWQDEKRGVARILFKEGSYWYWCTGSLVNNTLENGTPYFLTADHCGGTASASDRNQWIFYFNYESSGCANPGSSPGYNSLTGATQRSRGEIDGGSDFQLVELNTTPPGYFNIYYNGWDRSGASSSSGVGIHHPAGDIKKISTYSSTLTSSTWNGSGSIGATNAHWRTSWISTANGYGVTEGGSSGSPIFNSSGRILGTLTGGSTSCNDPYWDYYGKFAYHWQSNGSSSSDQLKPWLDSNSSGVTYLNGYDPNAIPSADFEADNTSPSLGQAVNFTDLTINSPTSWSWSFTPSTITYIGGTNSSSQHPQVQFNAEGNYTVSLTASNSFGSDNETKTDYINVAYYCGASGAFNFMHISNVQLGTINNSSGQSYYADYTYLSTDLNLGQSNVQISVVNGYLFGTEDLGVWIDWNQDGDFYDVNENVVCEIDNGGQGTFSFDVPADATLGTTRMRVRIKYSGSDCGDPCGSATYGEVEDYSVNIILAADPPVADFEADNLTPGIGETVNFTDLSTNSPISWQWSFSPSTVTYVGGTNQNSQNPQVQFNAYGAYSVALSVTNPSGSDMEVKTDYILVIAPPVADFEADNTTPGIGETVSFTDLSTNSPTSWAWTFTPSTVTYVGGTTASDQNPQVTFDAAGNYTVELIATNISGGDTETKVDYIFVIDIPDADFEADNMTPGIGETVSFTDLSTNSPTSWAWTFTPSTITYIGGTTAADQNPQVTFDAAGNYIVELTATNISGGDTETKVDYIFVIDIPVADFEADNTTPGIGETVSFTDLSTNSPTSWAWTFTPSTVTYVGSTTASDQNPQVTFDAAGNYTVELTATNISGGDTETKVDYINVAVPYIDLEITVFLEGPYNGSLMNTHLIPVLPLNQPFIVDPWYYAGTESVVAIPGTDIVDWALVELRDATAPSLADGTTSFDWQAAFIRNDGNIVDIDGNPVLHFESTVSNSLFAVIHHRNHLSVMTANGIVENDGTYSYDFSNETDKAYGTEAQKLIGSGTWGMYGGEGVRNGQIDLMDKSQPWENEAGTEGYLESDYNLDTQSDNKDKADIWTPNQGQGSQVPN